MTEHAAEDIATVDADEIDDETYADDQDDDDRPTITAHDSLVPPPASMPARFVRDVGGRQVETYLSIDGPRVRMASTETCSSPEAAKEVEQHLRELLLGSGYKEG